MDGTITVITASEKSLKCMIIGSLLIFFTMSKFERAGGKMGRDLVIPRYDYLPLDEPPMQNSSPCPLKQQIS